MVVHRTKQFASFYTACKTLISSNQLIITIRKTILALAMHTRSITRCSRTKLKLLVDDYSLSNKCAKKVCNQTLIVQLLSKMKRHIHEAGYNGLDVCSKKIIVLVVFTVRRYALHGICDSNSVCLSVCHTRGLCLHGSTYDHDFLPYGSPIILVSGDITFIPKFKGGHPKRGRWMRVGWVRIGDFRPITRRISETVRDTTKVTINH